MDYKEKYEQALEVAQRFYNNSVAITKKGLEDIFPELAGSEDERIRKRIIDLIKEVVEDDSYHVYRFDEMIAWLEKQGEQGANGNKREILNSSWSEEDELQMQGIIDLLPGLTIRHNWLKSLKDRVQPKQEWSKDDRRHIEKLILNVNAKECPDEVNWLISLHEKIAPPYWDKEDEEMLNQAIQEVEYALNDKNIAFSGREPVLLWLKHLRPQSQWKPSDEQLEALKHFVRSVCESGYTSPYDNNTKLLYSLLSDLKKLKE